MSFARVPLDISDLASRHNYVLGLLQNRFEEILAGWVAELAVPIHRGREVVGFTQNDAGVDIEISDGGFLRAQYVVGCDGGRSVIRKAASIVFAGWDPTISSMVAEVELRDEPELGYPPRRQGHSGNRPPGGLEAVRGRRKRDVRGPNRRADSARSQPGAGRRVGNGLRRAQPDVDLPVHGHDPAGGLLSRRTRLARRRRRARALPGRRPGPARDVRPSRSVASMKAYESDHLSSSRK